MKYQVIGDKEYLQSFPMSSSVSVCIFYANTSRSSEANRDTIRKVLGPPGSADTSKARQTDGWPEGVNTNVQAEDVDL